MIRFEVTGATPEEFAENAMEAWGLLAIGLQQAFQPRTDGLANLLREMQNTEAPSSPAPEQASLSGSPPKSLEMSATSGSESSSTASKVAKPATTVHSDKLDDLFVEQKTDDPAPKAAGTSTGTPSDKKKATKGPKLDDLKTRLSEVIVAATERWDQKRANAYARKLLNEWRAPKLSDLATDQYEIFMQVSAAYLDGTAAE